MSAINYLQINIIPILALILMRISTRNTLSFSWRSRALRFLMVLLVAVMAANTGGDILNGKPSEMAYIGLWIFNTIYFIVINFIAYLWFLYVRDVLEDGVGQRGSYVMKQSIPVIIFAVIILVNPWMKWIFYIDENHCYARGNAFWIHSLVLAGYALAASFYAVHQSCKETEIERKRECRSLAYFVILPVIGGVVEIFNGEIELLLPLTAASLLMVYLNVQQRQVTRDGLTGLNNRRRLNEYLAELEKQNWGKTSCHMLVMDVDKFKKINDTYGHLVGDQVLKLVAEQLKKTFGDSKAFIARFGGDEFVVILKGKMDEEVQADIATLRAGLAKANWGDGSPWKIAISVGCARYKEIPMTKVKELMELADARMYEDKNRNKQ